MRGAEAGKTANPGRAMMFQPCVTYLTAIRGVIRLIADPSQTDAVFEIGMGIKRTGLLCRGAGGARTQPRSTS